MAIETADISIPLKYMAPTNHYQAVDFQIEIAQMAGLENI